TSDTKPPVESAFQTLFEDPDGEEGLEYRRNLAEWIDGQADLNTFHWELEFPSVFHQGGFDAVVANPPFTGDKNLRQSLGSDDLVDT
ncbi:MAG: Eco57I restriction-modification methylase domain-containing protein, partial [Candidatus Aenigmatarchaeota archaeon]